MERARLAEKVTVGDSAADATPTARDSFHYGPDGARYFKKTEWAVESGTTTTMKTSRKYYAGAYEKTVTVGGDTVERTRIGDSVVHVRTTPAGMMATPSSVFEYVHRDHLGSVEAVTDAAGELVVLGHDPYGERRDNDWTARLTKAEIETLLGAHGERVSRGFTGHEHLDRTGLDPHERAGVRPAPGPVPEPGPDRRGSHFQPVVEPLQLRRQQPVELCRPDGAGSGGAEVRPAQGVPALWRRRRLDHADHDGDSARRHGDSLPLRGAGVDKRSGVEASKATAPRSGTRPTTTSGM